MGFLSEGAVSSYMSETSAECTASRSLWGQGIWTFLFWLRQISLCHPGWPETPYVVSAGLGLTEHCLPLPPKSAGIKGIRHHTLRDYGFSAELCHSC